MDTFPDFYKSLLQSGAVGIIAAFAIWLLNKAWKEHAEERKQHLENEKGRTEMLVGVIKDNTHQTTINTTVLNSLHRRLDKDAIEREKV